MKPSGTPSESKYLEKNYSKTVSCDEVHFVVGHARNVFELDKSVINELTTVSKFPQIRPDG